MTDADGGAAERIAAARAALGGDPARAEALALAALDALGEDAGLRGVLAAARLALGRPREAIVDFRLARKWGGDDADLLFAMGVAYRELGRIDAAAECWEAAIVRDPGHADAIVNRTLAAMQAGEWKIAATVAAAGLDRGVGDPCLPLWLGHAYAKQHRDAEAAAAYRRAIAAAPENVEAWFALALALRDISAFAAARAALARVLDLDPGHADAGFEAAQLHLMAGDWEKGFALWDRRLARRLLLLPDDLPGAAWNGEPLPSGTLLLQAEQGFGDALQFLRYAPLAAERVGRLVLRVHPQLVRLLERADAAWSVVPFAAPVAADAHAPLLSLPRLLGVFDPRVDLAACLAVPRREPVGRPRIGLVWAGNPAHYNDSRRSSSFAEFLRLRRVSGCDFVHFQFGADAAAIRRDWPELVDGTAGAADFADTAARYAACDLLVGVDTAAVHLAGAIGVPAWVLVPKVADWRWGEAGERSPWYATARVLRQETAGDWAGLLERVAAELATRIGRG